MNALQIMERVKDLRSIKDESHTLFLLGQMEKLGDGKKKELFAQSDRAGGVFIYESPEHKGQILEVVAGVRTDDFMTCLYRPHSIFNAPGELVKVREELIGLLEKLHQAIPGTLGIADYGRGRRVELRELATMQIRDMIEKRFRDKGY
jgi:hypothetical protein